MNRYSSALVAALLLAGGAQAHDPRNQRERAQDRHEVRQDKRERRDDRRDVAALKEVLARFDAAWAGKREHEMMAVESRLRALVQAELAEGRVELAADKAEVRRSKHEARHADGPHERRDDRNDLRDDRRDVRVEKASQRERVHVARQLSELVGSRRPADLKRQRALIVELIRLGEQELRQDGKELREDRREKREDRRQG